MWTERETVKARVFRLEVRFRMLLRIRLAANNLVVS